MAKRTDARYIGPADDWSLYDPEIREPAERIDAILSPLSSDLRELLLAMMDTRYRPEHVRRHVTLLLRPRPGPRVSLAFKRELIRAYDEAPRGKKRSEAAAVWKRRRGETPSQDALMRQISRIRRELGEGNRDK
jgi:hypothetical protein